MANVTHHDSNQMQTVLHIIRQISVPYIFLVCFVGIAGNSLTVLMLARRSLSRNFNNCTLIALALTDLLFNLTLICRCVDDFIQLKSEALSQFTAQRFVAVRFPLSVFIEKRIHLIHYVIVSLLVLFGVVYCMALVHHSSYDDCHEELQLNWFISDAVLSFFVPFTLIIVLNILIVLHLKKSFHNNQPFRFRPRQHSENFPLTRRSPPSQTFEMLPSIPLREKVSHAGSWPKTKNSSNPRSSSGDVSSSNGRLRSWDLVNRSSSLRAKSQSYRVTKMLILVSSCFLLLNAPLHISAIGLKIYSLRQTTLSEPIFIINASSAENHRVPEPMSTTGSVPNYINDQHQSSAYPTESPADAKWTQFFYLLMITTQHISFTSYSINFFLYSFCGIKFRRELIRCISKQSRAIPISRSLTVQNTL